MTKTPDAARKELARDIVQYVMENDILTQHGLKGLRERLEIAIPDDVAWIYNAMMKRCTILMNAKLGTPERRELDILVAACQRHEETMHSFS